MGRMTVIAYVSLVLPLFFFSAEGYAGSGVLLAHRPSLIPARGVQQTSMMSLLRGNEEGRMIKKLPLTTRLIRSVVRRIIERISVSVGGLDVRIYADSNRHALSGNFRLIDIFLDHIEFESVRMSGGGHFQVEGLDLRMRNLVFPLFGKKGMVKKAFEVYADIVMTQKDVTFSPLIQRLVQQVIDRILDAIFDEKVASVKISSISPIKKKIAVKGVAVTAISGRTPFLFTTKVKKTENGHEIVFKDPVVILNPDSLPTIIPVSGLPPIVCLGDNARIESLKIDENNLRIVLRSVISPMPPLQVGDTDYKERHEYYFDLSLWLSQFLKQQKVIA